MEENSLLSYKIKIVWKISATLQNLELAGGNWIAALEATYIEDEDCEMYDRCW